MPLVGWRGEDSGETELRAETICCVGLAGAQRRISMPVEFFFFFFFWYCTKPVSRIRNTCTVFALIFLAVHVALSLVRKCYVTSVFYIPLICHLMVYEVIGRHEGIFAGSNDRLQACLHHGKQEYTKDLIA